MSTFRNNILARVLILCVLAAGIIACGSGSSGDGGSSQDPTPAPEPGPSIDATLSILTFSAGSLSPQFASDIQDYTLIASSASTTVTPTVNQAQATISVDGKTNISGTSSAAIPLSAGSTIISIVVTAEDGSTTQIYTVTVRRVVELELLDPTPGAGDQFGTTINQLANGNIVVSDPFDSSVAASNGAVHLYSPTSSIPIASTYGEFANDALGSGRITSLGNNNYVVASPYENENGVERAGSVRLFNGITGEQIGTTFSGDAVDDQIGNGSITALGNNNYVVSSSLDNEAGVTRAGSVRLFNGYTGEQIGTTLAGDVAEDQIGFSDVIVLGNNNYIVVSPSDTEGGISRAGSVRLFNGNTGEQIGDTLAGDVAFDSLGSKGITVLGNNNYVVASPYDDEGGIEDAGSVRLMNGNTGTQIGATLVGDIAFDALGSDRVTALGNNNYVVASRDDDEGGIEDAGSVRLMDGTTGEQIGATLAGDVAYDSIGDGGAIALDNNNYVVASPYDNENGIYDAGSVRLMNGSTGEQIGTTLAGDVAFDKLGSSGIVALGNNNYVIASRYDTEGGIASAGSVRLMNGNTGAQIGSTLAGDVAEDQMGYGRITPLRNNNYVVASRLDDEAGITDAGSVRLMNGSTGEQIGPTLAGDVAADQMGYGNTNVLENDNYAVTSWLDDEGGITNAGSVYLMSGNTGVQIGTGFVGAVTGDFLGFVHVISSTNGDYFILGQGVADNQGKVNSGSVRIVVP